MLRSDKKRAILIAVILAASMVAAIPTGQAPPPFYPEPDLGWENTQSSGDVTDVAVGDLTNGGADVAFIDHAIPDTAFAVYGNNGTEYWKDINVSGYSIAVGDIDGDEKNEVVAGGWNKGEPGITVFEDDGTVKFFYDTDSMVTDIEIGDIDNDGTDDIIACDPADDGWIYVINSIGENVTGWPVGSLPGRIEDIAIGNLDGVGALDIAALSTGLLGTLYVYNGMGDQLWMNGSVRGRSVEIGDVDGDDEAEVVIGEYGSRNVFVYDGDTGNLEYSFPTNDRRPTEVELGDLDGDDSDVEIAVITGIPSDASIFAIDINATGQVNELWNFSIEWEPDYYGEDLAIGDVDRDYKNEVVAGNSVIPHRVWVFDGVDSNGDGQGDVVWMYYVANSVTDVEVGDVDGDGDTDVIVGTSGVHSVYALFTEEHTANVGGETIFFDSDPSNITEVASVPMPPNPPEGYNFPYGVFAINITVITPGQWAIITITLPDDLPANAEYWKYSPTGNGSPSGLPGWYPVPLESNDGDNIIVIRLQDGGIGDADGVANGWIIDPSGPAIPLEEVEEVPALTQFGLVALIGLLTVVAIGTIARMRKKS